MITPNESTRELMGPIYRAFKALAPEMILFSVRILNEESETLKLVFRRSKKKDGEMPETKEEVPVEGTASGKAVKTRLPNYVINLDDPEEGRDFHDRRQMLVNAGYLSFVSIPLFDCEDGEIIGVINIYTDKAGKINIESDAIHNLCDAISKVLLEQKHKEREQRNSQYAAIGRAAAIVVHELKQPLTSIGGFARIIERRADDCEEMKVPASIIVKEVERMEKIIQDFLILGRNDPKKKSVDIVGLIKDIIGCIYAEDVIISAEFHTNEQIMEIDPAQISSLLRHLLENAIEASKESGGKEIFIRTRAYDAKKRHSLRVEIENRGFIPEEIRKKIFHPSFTTKKHGTGIGLSSAMVTAEMHGGTIKCKSWKEMDDAGKVIFRLYLPRP